MRHILGQMWQRKYRLLLMLVAVFVLFVCLPVYADSGWSDRDLYEVARKAAAAKNWLQVAEYLRAYIVRRPVLYVNNASHKNEVDKALADAEGLLYAAVSQASRVCYDSKGSLLRTTQANTTPYLSPLPGMPASGYPLVCRGGGNAYFN
jgi:hypothetical protein